MSVLLLSRLRRLERRVARIERQIRPPTPVRAVSLNKVVVSAHQSLQAMNAKTRRQIEKLMDANRRAGRRYGR